MGLGKRAKKQIPLRDALLKAMEVAGKSVEAAKYLVERFTKILKDAGVLDQCQDMLDKVKDFAKYTEFKLLPSTQPWTGQPGEGSSFKNMQDNIAKDAVSQFKNISAQFKFDFAMDNQAHFLRGFSSGGNPLDANSVKAMDNLFNAWLAENNMISKDGVLYQCDENGNKGKVANAAQVKELIGDAEKGFASYLDKKGIHLSSEQHEYPTQTRVEKQEAIKATIRDNKSLENVAVDADADMEPEAPSQGVSTR